MGKKVNPFIFRVSLNRNWNSVWYTKKNNYSNYLLEDISVRNYLEKFFKKIPLGRIMIFKNLNFFYITIYLKKISFINKINIRKLKDSLSVFTSKEIFLNFKNISNFRIDVKLICFYIKKRFESRKTYKSVIKNVMIGVFKSGALGLKIIINGRINGNIMTRKQVFFHGKIPTQRFCANIRYHSTFANTIHGCIGIKVWLYLGDFIY